MLTPAELLDVWERGLDQSLTEKAVSLVGAARPDLTWDEIAHMPIGERDRFLLNLREALFGQKLAIVTACPKCNETLESGCRVSDLCQESRIESEDSCVVERDGYRVIFRLLTSTDILSLPTREKSEMLRKRMLALCVLEAYDCDNQAVAVEELPSPIIAEITDGLAAADPQADVMLQLACPDCQHQWRAVFDVAGFLSKEIHFWAQRTVRDVHELARAYGWREADVLGLSPTRRQIYLELARS
jgi:hypothetical protein